jgi:hypothetical protein
MMSTRLVAVSDAGPVGAVLIDITTIIDSTINFVNPGAGRTPSPGTSVHDHAPGMGEGVQHPGPEQLDHVGRHHAVRLRIPAIPYTQSGVFVHPGPTWVSEAA